MIDKSPYDFQPDKAFWSRSVSKNYHPISIIDYDKLLKSTDKVVSAGSCFASNLIPYIESAGIKYIRTEKIPKIFSDLGENLGYANFSAAYGNIYTARQLLQMYKRSLGEFHPEEYYWQEGHCVIDPFRPGLKFPALTVEEFKWLTKHHLNNVRVAFESADVFIFTFGLTEAWVSAKDGAVFPACPGTIAGKFNTHNHKFKNFTVTEIVQDMSEFIELLQSRNKKIRFILSVSPVPLVATATNQHVLNATTYSKSVLRVAAEELAKKFENVKYFPAFEIVTSIPAPKDFFEPDLRNVSKHAVEIVMDVLLSHSELSSGFKDRMRKILGRDNTSVDTSKFSELSKLISIADCDEAMQDRKSIN